MLFLSNASGRFPVGATTFVTRVQSPRQVGSFRLRDTNKPALCLSEVGFTAYYPAGISTASKEGLDWVLRPLNYSLQGFVKFTGISFWLLWPVFYLFGALIQIPVYPNAPLLRPQQSKGEGEAETYSLTAWEAAVQHTASSGRVVLAMEHRDGTGCACVTSDGPVYYYKDHDVVVDDVNMPEEMASLPLRADQLEFRREEIYTAYRSFCNFLKDVLNSDLDTIDNQPIERSSWKSVCFDKNITLAGHSFGGCTVLSILSSNPPSEYLHIPVSHALIFDPWLEPLPLATPIPILLSQDPAQPIAQSIHNANPDNSLQDKSQDNQAKRDSWLPQMLVINSEVFTLWKDHYTRLQSVVKAWEPQGGRLLTLVASRHEAFSDFPSLPIIGSSAANTIMNIISRLSIAFLNNELEEDLSSASTREMEIKVIGKRKDGKPKRKLTGNVGDIVVA